jgi:hypothetical protein
MSVEEVDWEWGSIPSPVNTNVPDPIEPEPTWEQSPSQLSTVGESAPQELWDVHYLGSYPTQGTVMLTREEIKQHLRTNEPFDLGDGRILPANKVLWVSRPTLE